MEDIKYNEPGGQAVAFDAQGLTAEQIQNVRSNFATASRPLG